jgi:hypothetical protein
MCDGTEFLFGVMNLLECELYSFVFRNEKAYSSKKKTSVNP